MAIDLHVVVTRDDDVWDAVCLEMGLATSARDPETLKGEIARLIFAHILGCLEEGRPQDILVPAPAEDWAQLAKAMMAGTCHAERLDLRKFLPDELLNTAREQSGAPAPSADAWVHPALWKRQVKAHSFVCR